MATVRHTLLSLVFLLGTFCGSRGADGDDSGIIYVATKMDLSEAKVTAANSDASEWSDLPLVRDCHTSQVDLLLVGDGEDNARQHFGDQMDFFHNFLDVFDSGNKRDFKRVNVSLVMSCADEFGSSLRVLVDFDQFSNLADLQAAFLRDVPGNMSCQRASIEDMHEAALGHVSSLTYPGRTVVILAVVYNYLQRSSRNSTLTDIDQKNDIKFLTVLIRDNLQYSKSTIYRSSMETRGTVLFSTNRLLHLDQGIPLVVCKQCYPGWVLKASDNEATSVARSSCYKILPQSEVFWMNANRMCIDHRASLVAIETLQEREFLQQVVSEYLALLGAEGNSSSRQVSKLFIGLKRNGDTLQREFLWINDLPLTYSYWVQGEPYGRVTRDCVYWMWNLTSRFDRWVSVGCGDTLAAMTLCEAKADVLVTEVVNVTCAVSGTSKLAALQRGEVAFDITGSESLKAGALYSTSARELYEALPDIGFSFFFFMQQHDKTSMEISHEDMKMHSCDDSDLVIPYTAVCDFISHCTGGTDEDYCNFQTYEDNYRSCSNGARIPLDAVCDLFPDCSDKSDETSLVCSTCNSYMCPSGECLPKHWFLDGLKDCSGCRDVDRLELTIARSYYNTSDCVFTCNKTDCVSSDMLGDGVIQCTGPEGPLDEALGSLESTNCFDHEFYEGFSNWAPKCVYIKDVYGGVLGCRQYKHLENCEDFVCPEGYVKCPDSYCIPAHYVNDRENHCPFGEDEDSMNLDCTDLFKCSGTPMCLHPDRVCDNKKDCHFGDDELNCGVTCQPGFLCVAGTVVKSGYNTSVPLTDLSFVDHGTRYIDLSGINVSNSLYSFSCRAWRHLVHMNLSGCGVRINKDTICPYVDFSTLLNLDLSHNMLHDSDLKLVLSFILAIRTLNASRNINLKEADIPFLENLMIIDLSYTSISYFRLHESFTNLRLKYVNLKSTKITALGQDMFPKGTEILNLDFRSTAINNWHGEGFLEVSVRNFYVDSYNLCCPQLTKWVGNCHAPSDPFSSCSDLLQGFTSRVLLWANGLLAFFGNLVVGVNRLVNDKSSFRMAYGHFVAHLSVSDFLMGVYLLIIASADSYFRDVYFMNQNHWRHSPVCKLAGFLSALSSEVSMFFILLITLDRFLVIKFPFGQYRISGRYVHTLSAVAWVLGVCIAALPFLPPFQHWQTYTFNGVCLGLPLADNSVPGFEFAVAVFVFLNLALFLLIAFGQLSIYRAIAEVRQNVAAKTSSESSRRNQEIEITKRLFLVAASDFLCWFPVGIMGLFSLSGYQLGYDAYIWSATLVLPINSAMNPILYNASHIFNKFKLASRKLWMKITEVKSSTSSMTESSSN